MLATDVPDASTASGVHLAVTAPGSVTMVFFHQDVSIGKLASVTYSGGGTLPAPVDSAVDALYQGSLEDVQVGPDGQLWALARDPAGPISHLQLRDGLNNSATVAITAPYAVSQANLAFNGTQPIVEINHGSQIGEPVQVASAPSWSFAPVAGTWMVGYANDIVSTSSGARLVASTADASYRPVSGVWNGSTFTGLELTGDLNACAPDHHDLVTDPSGRVADVTTECQDIAVTNMADTRHAGVVRFSAGGTVAGGYPQIGTFANGTGWVAWGIESTTVLGNTLLVAPIRLPGQLTSVTEKKRAGSVTVTGPASCLPAVSVADAAKAKAGKGWKLKSLKLTLDGHKVSTNGTVDGASFASGSTHKLVGKAVFKKKPKKHRHHAHHRAGRTRDQRKPSHHAHHHKNTKTVSVALSFRVC